jgi:TPR repeat protein
MRFKNLTQFLFCISGLVTAQLVSASESDHQRFNQALTLFYNDQLDEAAHIFREVQGCCDGQAKYYLARTMPDSMASESITLLFEAANMGSFMAMQSLASRHRDGRGVKVDLLKATDFERAAQEAQIAQWGKSEMVAYDESGEEIDLALTLKQKIDDGDVAAMYGLARLMEASGVEGKGVADAAKLYEKAAILGHLESQYMIGYLYCRGLGVHQDTNQANQWLGLYQLGLECE